eukprot:scaffold4501_cov108-Isochrysis_galbana.AAC.9
MALQCQPTADSCCTHPSRDRKQHRCGHDGGPYGLHTLGLPVRMPCSSSRLCTEAGSSSMTPLAPAYLMRSVPLTNTVASCSQKKSIRQQSAARHRNCQHEGIGMSEMQGMRSNEPLSEIKRISAPG